jgi:uncharacterized membrane protein YtjA (UPF0391 family)
VLDVVAPEPVRRKRASGDLPLSGCARFGTESADFNVLLKSRVVPVKKARKIMLYWAMVFLIIAVVAGVLGFTGVYLAAAGIAKILFFVFLVLFIISLLSGGLRRGI